MGTRLLIFLLFIGTLQNHLPPQKVINALKQKFPSANNIKWQEQKDNISWEASFRLNEKKATATFMSDAHWVQSTLEITADELNESVKSSVKLDHPGCRILYAIMTEESQMTWYLVKIKCGSKETESLYDYRGMHFPKI